MAPRSAPPLGPRKHVRRSLIVSPGFQLRALLPLLTFLVLAAALLAAGLFYPLQQRAAREPDLRVRTLLHEQLVQVHERLWPLLLAAGLGRLLSRPAPFRTGGRRPLPSPPLSQPVGRRRLPAPAPAQEG